MSTPGTDRHFGYRECSQDPANRETVEKGARRGGAHHPADLADVRQETWTGVLVAWERLRPLWEESPERFRGKLFRIAKNKAVDRARIAKRDRRESPEVVRSEEEAEDSLPARSANDVSMLLIHGEIRAAYLESLEKLEIPLRSVWIMSFHLDLSHAVIAERLGISEVHSRVRKYRAQELLFRNMINITEGMS